MYTTLRKHPYLTLLMCSLFLYLIGLHFIGFVYSTPIVMFLVSLMLGLRHWLIGIVCYVLFTLLLNYVAFNFMQIILPTGVLFG